MPLHMQEEKRWEIFLETILNLQQVNVTSIKNDNIEFSLNKIEDLQKINNILQNPTLLKTNIIHAIEKETINPNDIVDLNPISEQTEALNQIFNNSGDEILTKLFDEKFIDETQIKLENFIDKPEFKTSIYNAEVPNKLKLKRLKNSINLLQSSLNTPQDLIDILLGKKDKIQHESENGEISEFAKSILSMDKISDTKATITFNYGNLLQTVQATVALNSSTSPIIASANKPLIFSLNRNYLLKYLHNIITTGIIFKQEGHELRPIIFQSEQEQSPSEQLKKPVFYILLDISQSMETNFPAYQNQMINIIQNIINTTLDWEINIISFNDKSNIQKFHSDKNNPQEIKKYINKLYANGNTNLNGVLYNSLKEIQSLPLGKNINLILFTDGKDTVHLQTEENVINVSKEARSKNSQFAMFSLGYGEYYNKEFFKTMAEQSGFTHIDLMSDIKNIEQFSQYIKTLNNRKVIFEFISDIMHFQEQCPANDIVIAQSTITADTKITHGEKEYNIGTAIINESKNEKEEVTNQNEGKFTKMIKEERKDTPILTRRGSYTEELKNPPTEKSSTPYL